MRLIIIGAGGYGRTVGDIAAQSGRYEEIKFLDDNAEGADILGKCGDFTAHLSPHTAFYPAFGNNETRLHWLDRLEAAGAEIPTLIHKTAYVSPRAVVERGTVVLPMAVVNTDVLVKRGCIINCGAVVDHGCIIDEGVHVCLNAVVKAENHIPAKMKIEACEVIENRAYPLGDLQ